MDLSEFWAIGLVAGFFVAVFLIGRFVSRYGEKLAEKTRAEMSGRMEALFKASFPELQPHFHPARVYEYVVARRARKAASGPLTWKNPPGFPAAAAAEIEPDGLRDKVRLVDAGGAPLAHFVYEEHPDGGVLRVGKGKLTANVKGPEPRVKYWHPQREFKWTPRTWKMQTGVSDSSLESSSSSSSHDDTSRSSTSSTAAAAAAGAGIVAAGGAFDGGGASAAWDEGGGASSSSSGGGSSDFGSVTSGSSSSSSTSY
jgi:hypothetical protein